MAGPNILLVMTDSSRTDTLGCYGGPVAVSPNLDRLAAQGVRFTQAHSTAPVCMPARCSLLTGTHTPTHGCVENGIDRRPDLVTLPELLNAAGYRTIMVGKTHFGGPACFDVCRPLHGEKGADVQDEYAGHLAAHGYARASRHPNPVPERLFCDAFLVDQTIEEIERHQNSGAAQPFFAMCSLPSPHSPLDPPGAWATRFDDVPLPPLNYRPGEEDTWPEHLRALVGPRGAESAADVETADGALDQAVVDRKRRLYLGLAAYTDVQIGRLLDYLDTAGLRRDTLVVFTSDHGQQYYDHGFNDKHTFYDESWRIPLLLSWPGVLPEGETTGFAMTHDLTATFAAVAGLTLADAPTLQGVDLTSGWRAAEPVVRSCATSVLHRSLALATSRWKLEYYPESGRGRLFDRVADPVEQQDLWESPPHRHVRVALLEALLTWRADLTDVQYLRDHTSGGGPVARRVAAQTATRLGRDAETRLFQAVAESAL
ncbi:MAG TPA: sulfatase-like hydrolase/transferase [Mycobacteriales bacterium]|jgi:arylsulfatase A-like enzyme|nr:sulfatase-like hydrolase/transferase [Mycobacteriales bacterium]